MPKLNLKPGMWPFVVTAAIIIGVFIGFRSIGSGANTNTSSTVSQKSSRTTAPAASSTSVISSANKCATNNLGQLIKVSISARHMWVCQGSKTVYDSAVVTGMEAYAADQTPLGTYHIYAKQTDTTLTGSDTTGAWSDPVHYWMPFLDNQYGTYGFHDATWRPNSAFGSVDPNSNQASHGCVELPLATSAWLYNWAQVGTTVLVTT